MKYILSLLVLSLPFFAKAQNPPGDFKEFVDIVLDLINLLIPVIIGLTLVVLVWGVVQAWIINGGDEKAVEGGKKLVGVGITALVIMIGIWGILAILRTTFGFSPV